MMYHEGERPDVGLSEEEEKKLKFLRHLREQGRLGAVESAVESPGLEFSEQEAEKLRALRGKVGRGELQGPEDTSSGELPEEMVARYPAPEPGMHVDAWTDLPLEFREAALRKATGRPVELYERPKKQEPIATVARESLEETVYRVLHKMHPELGVAIGDTEAKEKLTGDIKVWVGREDAGAVRDKVEKVLKNPLVEMLEVDLSFRRREQEERAQALIRQGELSPEVYRRALARAYLRLRETAENNLTQPPSGASEQFLAYWHKQRETAKEMLVELVAEPYRDDEIEEMLRPIIEREFGPTK